jgi:ABC-2 type transport system permease protein
MILIRPPSRLKIITAKAIISIVYSTILVLFMALLSLGLGFIMFGSGDLLVLDKGFLILTKLQAVKSFVLAYVLAIMAMYVIAGLSFLLSVLVDNSIGPIIGTMAIVIVSVIISETPIALFEKIRPFLFTTYTNVWKKAFFIPLPTNEIIQSILFLFCFITIFFGLAFYIFNKKDILT